MSYDDETAKKFVRKFKSDYKRKREEESQHKIKSLIDSVDDDFSENDEQQKQDNNKPAETDKLAVLDEPDMTVVSDYKSPAPKLPLDAFGDWREWIVTAAESKCAPKDYVALALLSATSSLLSNVRQGSPWKDWVEPTILWGMLVGLPSSNKSPALDVIRQPIRIIETELAEKYQEELKKYGVQEATTSIHAEQWQTACEKAIANHEDPPSKPIEAESPEMPTRLRLCISDITIQKAAVVAKENPRGLMLCRDELAGLLANLERHGGSDREFYLEAYGGRSYVVDRKMNPDPIIIERLSMAILGTIQPDKLTRLLTETDDDGFAARFLYVEPMPVKFQEPLCGMDKIRLLDAFKKLYELKLDEGDSPIVLPFSEQSKEVFLEWREDHAAKEKEVQGVLQSFMGKMPGVIVRISVVLSYLNWIMSDRKKEPRDIKSQYIECAVRLVDDYFIPMAKRSLSEYALPTHQLDARIIAKWILLKKRKNINLRDMKREKILTTSDAERYEEAIRFLERYDWLVKPTQPKGKTGRIPKTYIVNPKVHTTNE